MASVNLETPIASSVANGVTTSFPYSYTVLEPGDQKVIGYLSGVLISYVYGVDYTLTGLGAASGSVEFFIPPANGTIITRYRDTEIKRDTAYQNVGDFLAQTVNADFNRLYYLLQEIFAGGKGPPSAIRAPNGTTFDPLPGAPSDYDGYYIGLSGGQPVYLLAPSGTAGALAGDLVNLTLPAKGAALLGFNQTLAYAASTAGAKLRDWVSPSDYPWSADRTGVVDATAAVNACYAWCKANGKAFRWLNGTYKIQAATTTFELPRDDGSFSPTIGGGETTLAAEAAVTMSVALVFDGSVPITAESDDGVILQGPWTYSSSSINTSQLIGVLFGSTKDGYTTVRANMGRMNGFMLPIVVQGVMARSKLQAVIDGAAIAACVQSADGNTIFDLQMIRCYGGCIIGGWWLQRNRALGAGHMPSSFGGSYPATDIFRSCWGENVAFERMEWQAQPIFDARADSVDTFFNTYFFKSANSAIYPTGRATVNADAGFLAAAGYPTYRGVSGFVAAIISRNGRYGSNIGCRVGVSAGHSRAFLYVNAGSGFHIRSVYYENAGLVNPDGGTGAGNIMGTGRADPYRAGALPALTMVLDAEGSIASQYGALGGFNNAPGIPALDSNRTVNWPAKISTSSIAEFGGGARIGTFSGAVFSYDELTFTPGLSVGATAQTGLTVDWAVYRKIGTNTYTFSLQLSKASLTISGTGNVTVTGLPVAVAKGGEVEVKYFSMLTSGTQQISAYLSGTAVEMWKGANRATAITHADLTNGALVLQVSGVVYTA